MFGPIEPRRDVAVSPTTGPIEASAGAAPTRQRGLGNAISADRGPKTGCCWIGQCTATTKRCKAQEPQNAEAAMVTAHRIL